MTEAKAKPEPEPEAESSKGELSKGDRVKFLLPHNKAFQIVGVIVGIKNDVAEVKVEADGKLFMMTQTYLIPTRDLQPAEKSETHRSVGSAG